MTQKKRSFPERRFALGILVGAAGWGYKAWYPDAAGPGWAMLIGGPVFSVAVVVYFLRGRRDTNATLDRWGRRNRRNGGTASWIDHLKVSSSWAMRRKAAVVKPSLKRSNKLAQWWVVLRTPVTEYATKIGGAGRRPIWSIVEDVTGRFGGPRTGKTGELVCRIEDAPGAVLATSTKVDLVELSAPALRAKGRTVHLFNPGGIGNWSSTLKWSPLTGCRNPITAQRRARDLIPTSTSNEGERWDEQARSVLAVFLHAAALAGLPMRAVLAWVTDPGDENAREVSRALQDSPEAATQQLAAQQFFAINPRTQTSITTSVMPALRWLNNPRAAAIGDASGDDLVDVQDLIESRAAVFMLDGETGTSASLIAAFVAEFVYRAKEMSITCPGGRLDPALTLVLDEAALICPVPLQLWTADCGGRGITIHYSLQSRAQLRDRWGDEGAGTIMNNTATLMLYGGTRDDDDLRAWAILSGERDVPVETYDAEGNVVSTTTRREQILSEGTIANLPAGVCMISRRGMPICLGRPIMAWKRKSIRKAQKSNPYSVVTETNYAEKGLGEDLPTGNDDLRVGGAIPVGPATTSEPKPETKPETKPAAEPEPGPKREAKPTPSWATSEPAADAEPVQKATLKDRLSWAKTAPAPKPEPAAEPQPPAKAEPGKSAKPQPKAKPKPVAKNSSPAVSVPAPKPDPEPEPQPQPVAQYQAPQTEQWFTKKTED